MRLKLEVAIGNKLVWTESASIVFGGKVTSWGDSVMQL